MPSPVSPTGTCLSDHHWWIMTVRAVAACGRFSVDRGAVLGAQCAEMEQWRDLSAGIDL